MRHVYWPLNLLSTKPQEAQCRHRRCGGIVHDPDPPNGQSEFCKFDVAEYEERTDVPLRKLQVTNTKAHLLETTSIEDAYSRVQL